MADFIFRNAMIVDVRFARVPILVEAKFHFRASRLPPFERESNIVFHPDLLARQRGRS